MDMNIILFSNVGYYYILTLLPAINSFRKNNSINVCGVT